MMNFLPKIIAGLAVIIMGSSADTQGNPLPSRMKTNTKFAQDLWAVTSIRSWRISQTLIVDGNAVNASDSNPGTMAAPMRTIGAAMSRVHPGTRILIRPGVYRETLEIRRRHSGTATAPVILEAEKPGTVILSGADVWTGWTPLGDRSGIYSHPWEYTWGFGNDAFANDGAPNGLRGRRSEMVFVNGIFLQQVFKVSDMTPGTFFVTQKQKTIYVAPPKAVSLPLSRVEVAIRDKGLDFGALWGDAADFPQWIVVRGLAIRQYRGFVDSAPAVSLCGKHLLLENCDISRNNGTGFQQRAEDVVVRNCRVNYNGFSGMVTPPTSYPSSLHVLWERNETSYNNWRGAMGGFYSFAVGGIKVHRTGDFILRRHISRGNHCPGVWFDSEDRNILIDSGNFSENKGEGLCLELSKGPFEVRNLRLCKNQTGLGINNASHILLDSCVMQGNQNQIGGWSPAANREGYRYGYLTIRKCVIVGVDSKQSLLRLPDYLDIYQTLQSRNNHWYSLNDKGWQIGTTEIDFITWKARTRQDQSSSFGPLRRSDQQLTKAHSSRHQNL